MHNSLLSYLSNSPEFVKIEPSSFQKPCQTKKPAFEPISHEEKNGTINAFSTVPKLRSSLNLQGSLTVYENLIFFEHPLQPLSYGIPPERTENDIKTFSVKSRKRFFEFFASLNYSKYGIPVFVSATYHFDDPDTQKSLKNFLKKFYENLKNCLPPFHLIWKLEYQKRNVPHFHFGFFPLSTAENFSDEKFKLMISSHWFNLKKCHCKKCAFYSIDVRQMKDYKHAMIYISKEFCKLQDRYQNHDLGRVWGHSNNMFRNELYSFTCTVEDYHKIIDVKLKEDFKHEQTKLYISGLKQLEQNSSIFLNWKDCLHVLKEIQSKENKPILTYKQYKLKRKQNYK